MTLLSVTVGALALTLQPFPSQAVQQVTNAVAEVGTNCPVAYFVAARGSGQNDKSAGGNYAEGLGDRGLEIYSQLLRELGLSTTQLRAVPLIRTYPAVSVGMAGLHAAVEAAAQVILWPPLIPKVDLLSYSDSVRAGVDDFNTFLDSRGQEGCNSSPVIFMGYSQGAEVIHLGVAGRQSIPGNWAAVLLADAQYVSGDAAVSYYPRDHGQIGATSLAGGSTSFPAAATGRVLSLCFERDIVCNGVVPQWNAHFHGTIYDCFESVAALRVARFLRGGSLGRADGEPNCDILSMVDGIVGIDGFDYLLRAAPSKSKYPLLRYPIPSAASKQCLIAGGVRDHGPLAIPATSGYFELKNFSEEQLGNCAFADTSWAVANTIIRRANDNVSWMVDGDRVRHHIPRVGDDICWRLLNNVPVSATDVNEGRAASLREGAPWTCRIGPRVVRASDGSSWFVDSNNGRAHIPTTQRFAELASQYPVSGPWPIDEIRRLDASILANPRDAQPLQRNTIVRRADGVSWVVDDKGVRHHIPYAQDDTCWRLVAGYRVSAVNLGQADLRYSDEGKPWPCIIGDRVVSFADGSSWFVDKTNARRWIPDTATYSVLSRRYPVSGPWPVEELPRIPKSLYGDHIALLDPPPNTILRRTDGVSWVIDENRVRRHIPYSQDDTCWRRVRGLPVYPVAATYAQAAALPEADAKAVCIIGDRVVTFTDGSSWYIDKNNARHWIPDTATYAILARRFPVSGPWPASDLPSIPKGADQPTMVDPPVNTIIRRSDGVSWVVGEGGVRRHIPFAQDDVCWRLLRGYPVSYSGLNPAQAAALPEVAEKAVCIVGNRIVKSDDGASYFVDTTNTRHWIPDVSTFNVLERQMGSDKIVGPWPAGEVAKLLPGADQQRLLDAVPNTIIRRADGVSWVVDANRVRRHIPYAQDDVCWRLLRGYAVSATGLSAGLVASVPEVAEKAVCIIGDRVVRSSDGSSWYVDTANTRHWIPDTSTFAVLSRKYPVSGPWPAGDVAMIPRGGDVSPMLDAVPNTIIRRADGVSWVVDANRVRRHIPFAQDDVCWRLLRGYAVSATGLSAGLVASVPEVAEKAVCIIGDRVVRSSDGSSWYVDTANTRHWIPDAETFGELTRRFGAAIGPWPAGDIAQLPQGANQARLINQDTVRNTIVCRNGDGACWAVDSAATRHYVAYGDYLCLRYRDGWRVSRYVDGDQASSLPEGVGWGCSLDNILIDSGADYFMTGNTRRWVQDPFSWDCYAEGRRIIGIPQAEMNGLGETSAMPKCLADGAIRNKIITADNTGSTPSSAYFIDGGGTWHYINDGATWSCLTRKYAIYAQDLPWSQVNTRRREGAWATCAM